MHCTCVSTHILYKCADTYSTNSQACIKLKPLTPKKQLDHWDITKSGHFSRFIMDIQIQIAVPFLRSHASNSSIGHSHVLSSKRKSQSTCSYNHWAFEGIRMHIDNTGPCAITRLIFLPDKQSASLWAFSWHLTSAFPIESSLLMQKMKWLRGLLNISELFNHNFPP